MLIWYIQYNFLNSKAVLFHKQILFLFSLDNLLFLKKLVKILGEI